MSFKKNKEMKKSFIESILNGNFKNNKEDIIKTFVKNKQIQLKLKKNVIQKK